MKLMEQGLLLKITHLQNRYKDIQHVKKPKNYF